MGKKTSRKDREGRKEKLFLALLASFAIFA